MFNKEGFKFQNNNSCHFDTIIECLYLALYFTGYERNFDLIPKNSIKKDNLDFVNILIYKALILRNEHPLDMNKKKEEIFLKLKKKYFELFPNNKNNNISKIKKNKKNELNIISSDESENENYENEEENSSLFYFKTINFQENGEAQISEYFYVFLTYSFFRDAMKTKISIQTDKGKELTFEFNILDISITDLGDTLSEVFLYHIFRKYKYENYGKFIRVNDIKNEGFSVLFGDFERIKKNLTWFTSLGSTCIIKIFIIILFSDNHFFLLINLNNVTYLYDDLKPRYSIINENKTNELLSESIIKAIVVKFIKK
jgi:hypothetical protein